jgi:phosphatidylethanolamine/phosphatidyl-N-methylethanolamine N-methyltransferase
MEPGLFLRHALRRPTAFGSLLPSSRHLAQAMTAQTRGAQLLVELGAGTGAVTRALRLHHPDVPLVAVEAQPHLARHLRERFAGVDVRAQWAHEVRSLCRFLSVDPLRRLVQYTYQPRPPFDLPHSADSRGLRWRRVKTIWRNAPPAGVWVLQ